MRHEAAVAAFWRKAYEDNLTGMAAMVAYNLMLSRLPARARRRCSSPAGSSPPRTSRRRSSTTCSGCSRRRRESTLLDGLRRVRESSTTVGIVALVAAVWFSRSFWGALDTAFCRIYHRECRSWVRQKLFALGMLVVVLLFFVASVTIPTLQGSSSRRRRTCRSGSATCAASSTALTLAGGLVLLFAILCLVYWRVPRGPIPWRCVWPGALGATVAMGDRRLRLPALPVATSRSLRIGTSFLFVLIVLVWFYVLALILLAGAVSTSCASREPREA